MYDHPLRKIWAGIVARCENPNATGYEYWGGRGIKLHAPWRDLPAFIAGVEAEIGPRPGLHMTLDRKDVDGDYAPGNIRWLPKAEQPLNRRQMYNATEVAALLAGHHCEGCQCGAEPGSLRRLDLLRTHGLLRRSSDHAYPQQLVRRHAI
jgi:hypothetical protein